MALPISASSRLAIIAVANRKAAPLTSAVAFNFGYRFGETRSSELAIGAEHFSNGGLKDPNPGRNFFQVRYSMAF